MNNTLKIIALAGCLTIGSHVLADDSMTTTTANKGQTMKDCMAKQKATNSSMTDDAMKTVCTNQMKKLHKNGNDLATGPQANKSQN
jgi:pentapeptide MXKDX repeat protein